MHRITISNREYEAYTVQEVCQKLGMKRSAITNLALRHHLGMIHRLGRYRHRMFVASEVSFIASRKNMRFKPLREE
jgi:predicted DNA-binding transcriptional regulator AlpA